MRANAATTGLVREFLHDFFRDTFELDVPGAGIAATSETPADGLPCDAMTERKPTLPGAVTCLGRCARPALEADAPDLTRLERDVLALLSTGLPNQGMAERLGLGVSTVVDYFKDLVALLGGQRRMEAVAQALRLGRIRAIVPEADLHDKADRICRQLADRASPAQQRLKTLLHRIDGVEPGPALREELATFVDNWPASSAADALRGFLKTGDNR